VFSNHALKASLGPLLAHLGCAEGARKSAPGALQGLQLEHAVLGACASAACQAICLGTCSYMPCAPSSWRLLTTPMVRSYRYLTPARSHGSRWARDAHGMAAGFCSSPSWLTTHTTGMHM